MASDWQQLATEPAIVLAFVAVVAAHAFHVVTAVISLSRVRRSSGTTAQPPSTRSLSILLPFAGLEPQAEQALATPFALTDRTVRLIFCTPDDEQRGVAIVRDLIARDGGGRATLLIGRDRFSANPKLDNLEKAWAHADTEWIAIADCNIELPADYVERLFNAFAPGTGLVSAVPVGTAPQSFWSDVECAFLNTYQARLQLTADWFGSGFAHGKTMLFRRELLDRRGGLRALAFDIAEDSAATKVVRADGLRVRLVDRPLSQPLGRRSIGEVWSRQLRWAQVRRTSFPHLFAAEILSTSLLPAGAAAVLAFEIGSSPLALATASLAVWLAVEAALARLAGWPLRPLYLPACLCRDLLGAAIWPIAWLRKTYVWRGNPVDIRSVALHDEPLASDGRRAPGQAMTAPEPRAD